MDLEEMLAGMSPEELERAGPALAREQTIREVMADTGEARRIVVESLNAALSMDEEAVLDLCEGEPTTLIDALHRLISAIENQQEGGAEIDAEGIMVSLVALANYRWPAGPPAPLGPNQTLTLVEVTWSGDHYYQPAERPDLVKDWIAEAFNDRSDVVGLVINGG
jgi:hypothetical protein